MRSPIEMMVDKACGFDPANPPPVSKPEEMPENAPALMLEIVDAAKAWDRNHKKGTPRLRTAVAAFRAIGG